MDVLYQEVRQLYESFLQRLTQLFSVRFVLEESRVWCKQHDTSRTRAPTYIVYLSNSIWNDLDLSVLQETNSRSVQVTGVLGLAAVLYSLYQIRNSCKSLVIATLQAQGQA